MKATCIRNTFAGTDGLLVKRKIGWIYSKVFQPCSMAGDSPGLV